LVFLSFFVVSKVVKMNRFSLLSSNFSFSQLKKRVSPPPISPLVRCGPRLPPTPPVSTYASSPLFLPGMALEKCSSSAPTSAPAPAPFPTQRFSTTKQTARPTQYTQGGKKIEKQTFATQNVDWGSRFVGYVNWCSVVGTGLSGPTLRYCKILPVQQGKTQSMAFNSISGA
jgi:hypothetical protein